MLTKKFRGSIKAYQDIIKGRATVNQAVDTVAGSLFDIGSAAVGGGAAGKSILKSVKNPGKSVQKSVKTSKTSKATKRASGGCRRFKRATPDYLYDNAEIPNTLADQLPGSFSDVKFTEDMSPTALVDSALALILVLKLMSIAHVKSKMFFDEICTGLYSNIALDECSFMLHSALNKYEAGETTTPEDFGVTDKRDPRLFFADLLDGVEFEIKSLSHSTIVGHFLEVAACQRSEGVPCQQLEARFVQGLEEIDGFVKTRISKRRVKRGGGKSCTTPASTPERYVSVYK